MKAVPSLDRGIAEVPGFDRARACGSGRDGLIGAVCAIRSEELGHPLPRAHSWATASLGVAGTCVLGLVTTAASNQNVEDWIYILYAVVALAAIVLSVFFLWVDKRMRNHSRQGAKRVGKEMRAKMPAESR